ncbi:hypothetical protein DFP72DRAFT_866284 [Ephemerocybe angulata]|uniref:Uncharacterized protein n=1 Tax=Ephemerocybe angulata TaxID=980116 RepID=A0A8H6IJ26_9AGAR|nr:hypothetical protein DFP72DRAFT_866284 [Tulosesus angulatus]
MPITTNTSSPPGSGFTPRKEFIREQQSPRSSFAILALSGTNFIRLYSFSQHVIDGLQKLLQRQGINIACREDLPHNLHELSIEGKPWANPKSVFSEKLLLDIFAVFYREGYHFLSCIDYGREPDDKLAMAFSKPEPATTPSGSSRTGTPLLPPGSPALDGSNSSLQERPTTRRIPFAISFSSATTMRVISPPLHLTPAILQAVRGSWPRGVVSEKKVAENCFEFKLKGYKWFQQDNFAFDSLQHILSLLTSLDAQSFTLLTSISFTNRSRIKDLWVFTGPAPVGGEEQPRGESPNDLLYHDQSTEGDGLGVSYSSSTHHSTQHRRLASDTTASSPPMVPTHMRSATEDMRRHRDNSGGSPPIHQPAVLRKPAPRAQVPVSIQESELDEAEGYMSYSMPMDRANIPSTISSSTPNMTGIGTVGQEGVYPSSPFPGTPPAGGPIRSPFAPSTPRAQSPSSDHSSRSTPDIARKPPSNSLLSSTWNRDPPNEEESAGFRMSEKPVSSLPLTLLSPGAFRDSGLSDVSQEVPVRWTGQGKETSPPPLPRLTSSSLATPQIPGGWKATPIDERQEEEDSFFPPEPSPVQTTPIHETLSRVESPEVVRPNTSLRRSEAVVYGMMAASSPPPLPHLPPESHPPPVSMLQTERVPSRTSEKSKKEGGGVAGQGWVLVNVEGSAAPSPRPDAGAGSIGTGRPSTSSQRGGPIPAHERNAPLTPEVVRSPPRDETPLAAKAIVVVDAIDSRHKKNRAASANKEIAEGGSGVRRFFSLNRKNSKKIRRTETGDVDTQRERTTSESSPTTVPRSTIRDRLRIIGTPEATRREDKPRNID